MAIAKQDKYATEDARYQSGIHNDHEPIPEKETSILARVIRTVSVSMSFAEMDMLIGTFGRNRDNFTTGEQRIVDEFVMAVDAIR